MSVAIANPQVTVNNIAVSVAPNSVSYTEGFGEQTIRAASTGGSSVEQVFSQNIESHFSKAMFGIYPTPENINLARVWKTNLNANVITITGNVTSNGVTTSFQRTFTNAAILNDYDVPLGSDTTIELEFQSDAAA